MEQLIWLAPGDRPIEAAQLPEVMRCIPSLKAGHERRRQLADDLYQAVVSGGYSFWDHIHPLFLARDITRNDIRQLLRRGLNTTRGNYRSLLPLFRIPKSDYKRFLNFLAAHDCGVDYREFRSASSDTSVPQPRPSPLFILGEDRWITRTGATAREEFCP